MDDAGGSADFRSSMYTLFFDIVEFMLSIFLCNDLNRFLAIKMLVFKIVFDMNQKCIKSIKKPNLSLFLQLYKVM